MDTGNKPDLLSVLDLQEFRPVLEVLGFPGHLQDPLGLGLLFHPKSKLTHHMNLDIFDYHFFYVKRCMGSYSGSNDAISSLNSISSSQTLI